MGPGFAGALGSLFKVGGMNRGQRRRGRRGARMDGVKVGYKNAVELKLGCGRGVPVEDCIATTGSMPGKGCDAKECDATGSMREGRGG